NLPVSACRPMPPLSGHFMAFSITSPLHLHRAAAPALTSILESSTDLPSSFADGLPSLTISSNTSLSQTALPLTVAAETGPGTVLSSWFQSALLNFTLLYGPTVG